MAQNTHTSLHKVPLWRQLRWRLVFWFILLAALPVAVVTAIAPAQMSAQVQQQVLNEVEAVANLKQDQIEQWTEDGQIFLELILVDQEHEREFATILLDKPLPDQDQGALNQFLSDAVKEQSFFEELFIYDTKGRIKFASDDILVGQVVVADDYFAESLLARRIEPLHFTVGHGLTIIATQPLVDEESGQVVGALAGRYNLETLSEIMADWTGLGRTGETYLVSRESNLLLTSVRDTKRLIQVGVESDGINLALAGKDEVGLYQNYNGTPVLGAYRWLEELKVALLVEIHQEEAMGPFEQVRQWVMVLAVGAIVVAVAVGLYNATLISTPVTLLAQAAGRIAEGDFAQRANVAQHDEIGLLATSFNQMAANLRHLIANRETLYQISQGLNTAGTSHELLDVLSRPGTQAGAGHASLFYLSLDEKGAPTWVEAAAMAGGPGLLGTGREGVAAPEFPLSKLLFADKEHPTLISDVTTDPRVDEPGRLLLTPTGNQAVAIIPLTLAGRWVGLLCLGWQAPHQFSEEEVEIYTALTSLVAPAVENRRLVEGLEKRVAERTAELEQILAERDQLQQEIIEAQQRVIHELSTPIIPVGDRVIILPLIGSIDTPRAREITRALLGGISRHRAKIVIIDITGVPIVDSGVASHLDKTIHAARLKGARTIITGISDAVAEAVVDLGIDWDHIETLRDLHTGLKAAFK